MKDFFDKLKNKFNKKEIVIEYDMRRKYASCFNEAYGVATRYKKILKNYHLRTHSYTYYGFIYLWLTIIINLFACALYLHNGYTTLVCALCCIVPILYFLIFLYFAWYIIRLTCTRCRKIKGSFILDKNGLTDSTFKGIKMLFEWSKIKIVVIKKHTIVILTDSPIFFFVNKEIELKLLHGIKKYKEDIVIIRD